MNQPRERRGFTLLEVLLAMLVLSIMGLMIFGSFRSLVDATTTAEAAITELHLSDAVRSRIHESLRSAVFFDSDPGRYSFHYEAGTGNPPDDRFSWVTRSKAFLPADYPAREGLNRIELGIGEVDGKTGLTVRATSSLLDPESDEAEDVEPWLISSAVKGLELFFYDLGEQDWVEEWERDNQLPVTLVLRLYVQGEGSTELRMHSMRVDIPVGQMSRETRRGRRQAEGRRE